MTSERVAVTGAIAHGEGGGARLISEARLDTWFGIGRSHWINQDYALSGTVPFPWIVVADGCSSSHHTDVGARLLSWAASSCLQDARLGGGKDNPDKENPEKENFDPAVCAVRKAQQAWTVLAPGHGESSAASVTDEDQLAGSVLDATLLMAYVIDGRLVVNVYGDGFVALGRRDGSVSVIEIDYSHNAPLYLSYLLDNQRAKQWRKFSVNALKTLRQQGYIVTLEKTRALQLAYTTDDLAWVLLGTDGLKTFVNPADMEAIEAREVVSRFTDFRNTNGAFLKRRVKRQLNDWVGQGIRNEDDVAVACMLLGEKQNGLFS